MLRPAALVVAMLVTWTTAPSSESLTERERQHLLAHMDMTERWLLDEVRGLTEAQVQFRREPDSWNIAQIVDHIVVVAPIYWQNLQAALKQPRGDRPTWMSDADVLWYGIDRTWREKAISTELPAPHARDLASSLTSYRTHHDRLRNYIKTTRDDLRNHIVQRQGCDAYQWALLISTHEQRHILQIREVKSDPRFPAKQ
jgi:hypothetical protein